MLRTKELKELEQISLKKESSLSLVFGLSGVGKTSFINELIQDKDFLYLSCIEIISPIQIELFKTSVAKHFDISENKLYFNSIFDILKFISVQDVKRKLTIVIDDFHNLQKSDKTSLKQLLTFWNGFNHELNPHFDFVIVSSIKGSSDQEMQLYKKASCILELEELPYEKLALLLPSLEKKDAMYVYSAFGIRPSVLKNYDIHKDVLSNIKELLLDKDSQFFDYGERLIKSNLSDIATYNSILYAISQGSNKIGDIAKTLEVKSSYLTRYMQKLIDLMILDKKVPVGEDKSKSKFGRYYIKNRLLNFWYCYIYPNYSELKKGNTYPVINLIRRDFSSRIVQFAYKDYVLELIKTHPSKYIGFNPVSIGGWWNNTNDELDIIAYDKVNIVFIACKWKKKESNNITYSTLKMKSNLFNSNANLKKNYLIFSKTSTPQTNVK